MKSELLPVHLQLLAVAVLLAFLGWVVHLIRSHQLSLRDSLLWLLSTSVALAAAVFPSTLVWLAHAIDIRVPANAVFGLAFVYVLVNLLAMTIATSGNAVRIRRITQECTLLRAELDELRRSVAEERASR